jgi:lipopolysaccharide heptosyltransferase I
MALDAGEHASRVRRILVVKLSSLGDIILSTPCLRALRRVFPEARIHLAVEGRWADAVRGNPNLDGLIECSSQTRLSPRYLFDVHRRLSAAGPFDLALDFQGTRRSAAWIYLSRATIQAGRGERRPGWTATAPTDRSRHAVLVCADFCRSIGIPVTALDPEIHLAGDDERVLDDILDSLGLLHSDFVVLNPFSSWPAKEWPVGRAAELTGRIQRDLGLRVVVNGSALEAQRAESIVRLNPSAGSVSLAGRLALGQALCLFRRARLMVSCDSGPMHAAAALGTPVLALFGPTHPGHTGPWGEGHRVLQVSRPADHHAYRSNEGTRHMEALDVEMVFTAVKELMDAKIAQ